MSSPYVPSAAGLRYRRGWSSVFRSRKDELPLPPRPKDVDHHHAKLYTRTGEEDRPAARRELHANYAHEVAKKMEMGDRRYLEHLADDLGTHEAYNDLEKLRDMLHNNFYALFRPRLDAFFDMRLPTDEAERLDGADEALIEAQYRLVSKERHSRINRIESAVAVAWCRYQLDDLLHRLKLNTYTRNEIWEVTKDLRGPEDVATVARGCLVRERQLDYFLLLEATLKERIPELEEAQSLQWPLRKAKMAYKDSKKQSKGADNSASSTAAFHRTVARTCRDSKQPKSKHLRSEVQETGFWVAWALSRPDATHRAYGGDWPEKLGKFLEEARAQGLRDAGPTLLLLQKKEYRALAPFFEGRKPEVGAWELRPPRPVHRVSIPTGGMGNLYEPADDLSGTTPTAPSASTSANTSSRPPNGAVP